MSSAPLRQVAQSSPLSGAWTWRLAGTDPAHFEPGEMPGGYVDLVLDAAQPPLPFDDPSVVSGMTPMGHKMLTPIPGQSSTSG